MDPYVAVILVVVIVLVLGVLIWIGVSGFMVRVQTFENSLSPAQEVPPTTSGGSGMILGRLQSGLFTFTITASFPSTDTVESVGIYQGFTGTTGPILLSVSGPTSPPYQWSGQLALSSELSQQLLQGGLYVNILTRQYPNGAIRAQITPS